VKRVVKSILVPYTPLEVFTIVADIDQYPKFMPWCGGARVLQRLDNGVVASIDIAFGGVTQTFSTRNINDAPHRIDVSLVDGPFRHLQGHWQFKPLGEVACKVIFELEYDFKNAMLEMMIGPVFSMVANSFVDAFANRAAHIHGERI
jgi:ribosome-associated toxin RatA of RatAB toxin-antitoxin module